ncbi:MAG: hypothetical protein DYG89_42500, partial [Caldilinea sp. CFX5]|nr:hypothetical protein [Caldilinea sp. CFX5]
RTADIDRPMSMEAMADDVAAAVQQLGFDQVDLWGVRRAIRRGDPERDGSLTLARGRLSPVSLPIYGSKKQESG